MQISERDGTRPISSYPVPYLVQLKAASFDLFYTKYIYFPGPVFQNGQCVYVCLYV